MNLYDRARRKVRYLWDIWAVERLYAETLAPVALKYLFPARNRKPPDPKTVRTVLVWNVDSLGDFLWITSTLRALRRGYPSARIVLVHNRACTSLVENNPNVDERIAVDPKPYYSGRGYTSWRPELAGRRFDVMLVIEMGSRPADAGRILGRRLDVGYLVSTDLGVAKTIADFALPENRDEYWPRYFLRLAEHLGLNSGSASLTVFPTASDVAAVDAWLDPFDRRPLIGFHPMVAPYASLTKKWPNEFFVELAKLLATRKPLRLVLSGSREEVESCEELAGRIRLATDLTVFVAAGKFSPRQTASLFGRLKVLVVADTFALHLAAAMNTPTIALFGATDDRRIAPVGGIVLNHRLPCSPCHRYVDRNQGWPVCLFDHPKCMYAIQPQTVFNSIIHLLTQPIPFGGTAS